MKLKRLKIKNFVGIDEAEIAFDTPVTLFAGRNNQGKSTIKDAILFGLTGKARAQTKFKDVRNLARGENSMRVELEYQSGDLPIHVKRGISNASDRVNDDEVLRYCLNPNEFIQLSPKERASILSKVLGGGMDAVVKTAMTQHIGNIDETILAEIKGNRIDVLDVDVFRKAIVDIRRNYKRVLNDLPNQAPLLVDYVDDENYDVEKDREAVKVLGQRIQKGSDLLAESKKMLQDKARINELQKAIRGLEKEIQEVPKLPPRVNKDKLDIAPVYMAIQESMLAEKSNKCSCPICGVESAKENINTKYEALRKWYDKYSQTVQQITEITHANSEIRFKIETKQEQLKQLKSQLTDMDIPKGGEDLLSQLQSERDQANARIAEYRRYEIDKTTFEQAGQRREALIQLIAECDRIDKALKDGGPVKAAIAEGGKPLPINNSLLKAWSMENLSWSSNGEIHLGDIPVEYASESEKYRIGCIMGMALAEISGFGIVAFDGYEILDGHNANGFFNAFKDGGLSNALIFASTNKDYSQMETPEWLSIFQVDRGKIIRRS